jgi:predicted O-methyltransferase YrrM
MLGEKSRGDSDIIEYWRRKIFNRTHVEDQEALKLLVKNKRKIVEIGTFIGGTAEIMAGAISEDARIISIDSYLNLPTINGIELSRSEAIFTAQQRLAKYWPKITHIIGDSLEVASVFADKSVDLVFIDGDHSYEGVRQDILAWLPKIKDGGIISGHDFNKETALIDPAYALEKSVLDRDPVTNFHFGVSRAVDEFLEDFEVGKDMQCTVWWRCIDGTEKGHVSKAMER